MLNESVRKAINDQVTKEWYSAYLYLDFANYFDDEGLDGFANWYDVQAQEERDQAKEEASHAELIMNYLLDNDEKVKLGAIDAPTGEYKDHKTVLQAALEHERFITASINDIYAIAYKINDFRSMEFLNWFIKEQGEEEKNASDLIKKYELYGGNSDGLYSMNQELLARVYTPPVVE